MAVRAPALDVQNVVRRFGSLTAADHVCFHVDHGHITGFIGPNGAGKTTTMRICATLDLPDEGDVQVDGHSVLLEPRLVRKRLGFMPDSYGAYPSTTVREYLDFFARAYGLRGRSRIERLAQVMDFTQLEGLAAKEMGSLSKGMKQRLCLAKTMLHDPALFILDEPAAGLDPRARVELRELVTALAQMDKAVLISSHILSELSEMCDAVVVIEQGVIRASGTVEEITRTLTPHTPVFVRALGEIETLRRTLAEQPGVASVRPDRGGVVFDFTGSDEQLVGVLRRLIERGNQVVEFAPQTVDLEDVFLSLTEGKVQ